MIKDHHILWSSPFQTVNPRVKFSDIKCALDFPGKKANLRLCSVAWIWRMCYAGFMHVMFDLRVLPDTKEILTILFLFSSPQPPTV